MIHVGQQFADNQQGPSVGQNLSRSRHWTILAVQVHRASLPLRHSQASPFSGLAGTAEEEHRPERHPPVTLWRNPMTSDLIRRDILQCIVATSTLGVLTQAIGGATAQTGTSSVKVDTKGLLAKIKFEAVLG